MSLCHFVGICISICNTQLDYNNFYTHFYGCDYFSKAIYLFYKNYKTIYGKRDYSMTVQECARLLDKSPQFVRIGLQRGILPFGYAIKMSSKWTYHISEKKVHEYLGIMNK